MTKRQSDKTGFDKWKHIFHSCTGHELENFIKFNNYVHWLHRPVDGAALGVFRMLYGAAMLLDVAEERGGGQLDVRFGEPKHCHFPLFDFIQPLDFPIMGCVYLSMWLGALGIMLGYRFRLSCLAFIIPYWYIFLLDKPAWNNHSYLFGLVGSMLLFTKANYFCSLDKYLNPELPSMVPYWNYFIIKFQFFLLYMYAGLKKLTAEWLSGYAMTSLSRHWVFKPFRVILSMDMTDLLIVHWFTAAFDFSIPFFMTLQWTRYLALPFMISFHLMNTRLFVIGMFPWVCLAELGLFFAHDWPRNFKSNCSFYFKNISNTSMEQLNLCDSYKPIEGEESCEDTVQNYKKNFEIEELIEESSFAAEVAKGKIEETAKRIKNAQEESKKFEIVNSEETGESINTTEEWNVTRRKRSLNSSVEEDNTIAEGSMHSLLETYVKEAENIEERTKESNRNRKYEAARTKRTKSAQNLTTCIILLYCALQLFLPYSHFITKGYNNWTNGLYGYSWDMMVHTYDTTLTSIKIVDNNNGEHHYLDPYAFTEYDRWTKYADMAWQYARCINRNINEEFERIGSKANNPLSSTNISIYFDIWCSMNGRFQQRVFDPRIDLLKATWSPFERTKWSLPLLNELNHMRPKLRAIAEEVLNWNNYSDVVFVADFPGLTLDNYISNELTNASLTILEGQVRFRGGNDSEDLFLTSGKSISLPVGATHYVTTLGPGPSSYIYTFANRTMLELNTITDTSNQQNHALLPLWTEFAERLKNYTRFIDHIFNCLLYLLYNVPIPMEIRQRD